MLDNKFDSVNILELCRREKEKTVTPGIQKGSM